MIATFADPRPFGAALYDKVRRALEIVLHIGAHRTATTSLQAYARAHAGALGARGVTLWDPRVTRPGLLADVQPGRGRLAAQVRRAEGRLRMSCARAGLTGTEVLILSDENMMGTTQGNLRARALYPGVGERLARIGAALHGQVTRVVLSVRSLDTFWASSVAMTVARGHQVPGPRLLSDLAQGRRGWRDVVMDVACALPGAAVRVIPHETHASAPLARLEAMAGRPLDLPTGRDWRNRAPDLPTLRRMVRDRGQTPAILPEGEGRWTVFTAGQAAALRETYADDLHWLAAGADGMAQLITWTEPAKTGQTPHPGSKTRGHDHEQQGRLA